MKRYLTLMGLVLVMLPLVVSAASALQQPGTVKVITKALYSKPTTDGTMTVYQVFNPHLSPRSIGNGVLVCTFLRAKRQGPIPATSRYCTGQFTIGYHSLAVMGLCRNRFVYTLVVAGGTGRYNNVGGTMTSTFLGRGQARLVFRLTI